MHEIGNTAIRSLAGYVPWYRYMYVATYVEKSGGSLDVGITGKYGTNCSQTQFCFSGLFFGTVDRTASGQMHVGILSATVDSTSRDPYRYTCVCLQLYLARKGR